MAIFFFSSNSLQFIFSWNKVFLLKIFRKFYRNNEIFSITDLPGI
jgi:hypothetical protein